MHLVTAKMFIVYIGNLSIAETKLTSFYIGCIFYRRYLFIESVERILIIFCIHNKKKYKGYSIQILIVVSSRVPVAMVFFIQQILNTILSVIVSILNSGSEKLTEIDLLENWQNSSTGTHRQSKPDSNETLL
jgi:hypothetical protein